MEDVLEVDMNDKVNDDRAEDEDVDLVVTLDVKSRY